MMWSGVESMVMFCAVEARGSRILRRRRIVEDLPLVGN
jgi:hypothetical protein